MARSSKSEKSSDVINAFTELLRDPAMQADVIEASPERFTLIFRRSGKGKGKTDAAGKLPFALCRSETAQFHEAMKSAAVRTAGSTKHPHLKAAGVIERAVEVIGDREEAMRWLGTPVRALGYATPISKLGDEDGAKEVMDTLAALEQGAW